MQPVKVAIVDVGSNSVRLMVASVGKRGMKQLHRDRVYVRLGDDAYALGKISRAKLEETREVAGRFARTARKKGADRLETIVTAPGRQASNSAELIDVLSDATQASVVVLSADDEGRLAWEGAVARMDDPPATVAVVDLGGGSCEVAVGAPDRGPDLGALGGCRSAAGHPSISRRRPAVAKAARTCATGDSGPTGRARSAASPSRARGRRYRPRRRTNRGPSIRTQRAR